MTWTFRNLSFADTFNPYLLVEYTITTRLIPAFKRDANFLRSFSGWSLVIVFFWCPSRLVSLNYGEKLKHHGGLHNWWRPRGLFSVHVESFFDCNRNIHAQARLFPWCRWERMKTVPAPENNCVPWTDELNVQVTPENDGIIFLVRPFYHMVVERMGLKRQNGPLELNHEPRTSLLSSGAVHYFWRCSHQAESLPLLLRG